MPKEVIYCATYKENPVLRKNRNNDEIEVYPINKTVRRHIDVGKGMYSKSAAAGSPCSGPREIAVKISDKDKKVYKEWQREKIVPKKCWGVIQMVGDPWNIPAGATSYDEGVMQCAACVDNPKAEKRVHGMAPSHNAICTDDIVNLKHPSNKQKGGKSRKRQTRRRRGAKRTPQ